MVTFVLSKDFHVLCLPLPKLRHHHLRPCSHPSLAKGKVTASVNWDVAKKTIIIPPRTLAGHFVLRRT